MAKDKMISKVEQNRLEKVKQIKALIKKFKNNTLEKIVTREKEENTMFRRPSALKKWLDENDTYKNFTDKELMILGYDCNLTDGKITSETMENKEVIENNSMEKKQEITNGNEVLEVEVPLETNLKLQTNTDVILGDLLSQNDVKEKLVYLLSNIDEFLGIKQKMEKSLVIPADELKNESMGVTIRLWKKAVEEMNKFCDEHRNYTKIQIMSYAFLEFIEKYK